MAVKEYGEMIHNRIKQVTEIGMQWSFEYNSYIHEKRGANIGMVEIKTMTDDEFNKVLSKIKEAIK